MTQWVINAIEPIELERIVKSSIREVLSELIVKEHSNAALQKEILSRKEASELLGTSLPTLDTFTKRGLIKGFKLGRSTRYKREDLLKSLRQMDFGCAKLNQAS